MTTARDVRQRIGKGESPLPANLAKRAAVPVVPVVDGVRGSGQGGSRMVPEGRGRDLLQRLRNDPSVRSSERGRALLRLPSTVVVAISACHEFAETAPIHCSGTFAEIARKNARAWQEIAEKFECNAR